MAHQLNPVGLFRDSLDWSGRSSRRQLLAVFGAAAVPLLALRYLETFGGWARLVEVLAWLLLSALIVPVAGHVVRRLNEINWPAGLGLLLFLPWIGPSVAVVLLLKDKGFRRLPDFTPLRAVAFGALILLSLVTFTRIGWSIYPVDTQAMKPALFIGDRVKVGRVDRTPDRGDVIALHDTVGTVRFSRVIGLPGDNISLTGGTVFLNGTPLLQEPLPDFAEVMAPQGPNRQLPRCANGIVGQGATCLKEQSTEKLPDGPSYPILDIPPYGPLDSVAELTVPPGHYFALGDNRDNALDSRVAPAAGGLGLIPQTAVIGRVHRVLYATNGSTPWFFWLWRGSRTLKGVE